MNIAWEPILKHLGSSLNFKSDSAAKTLRNAYDHHKSWAASIILLVDTVDELLLPFDRQCMLVGT
jgi:hypothetical protein